MFLTWYCLDKDVLGDTTVVCCLCAKMKAPADLVLSVNADSIMDQSGTCTGLLPCSRMFCVVVHHPP